ncbi:unnamed protein product [Phytophthora lilii]|uniref:Unnamed protein product n=1 Tax=Phytophthora lilii TaxID=2077276 RepID=A0A9W6UBX4_9STRA|nr:unnamed protein product [Phytophthora lilii]
MLESTILQESLQIKPIKRKTGKDDNRYFLGEKGSLIAAKTGRKSKTYQSIDWVATEEKIRDIWYDGESKSIDESSYMRFEDPLCHASLTRKRKLADPSEGDYADRTKQRLQDSFEFDTSTSTSLDQVDTWVKHLRWIKLDTCGFMVHQLVYLVLIVGESSQRLLKKVDWRSTFQEFIDLVKDRDDVDLFTNEDTTKLAKAFEPRDGEARHGIKIGIDEDMNSSLTNADNDAKKILMDYYSKIVSEGVRIPFRLKPIVDTKSGVEANQNYYFSEPTAAKLFYIRNQEIKAVSGKVFSDFMKTIRWMDTFNSLMTGFKDIERNTDTSARIKSSEGLQYRDDTLQKLHDESEAAFLKYGEAQRKNDEAKRAIKGNKSKSARSALKAATAAMKRPRLSIKLRLKASPMLRTTPRLINSVINKTSARFAKL